MGIISDYFYQDVGGNRTIKSVDAGSCINYKHRKWVVVEKYPYIVRLQAVSPSLRGMEYGGSGTLSNFDYDYYAQYICLGFGDLVMLGLETEWANGYIPEKK